VGTSETVTFSAPQTAGAVYVAQTVGDPNPAGFEKMAGVLGGAPDAKCEPVDAGGVPAEWVAAPGIDAERAVLYLHGGGYAIGSLNTHRRLAYDISAAAGARVLVIDYRLAPEHPFPAAVDDAAAAWRWMLAQGLVDEVKALRARGDLSLALPSMRCVGYRQVWEALDANDFHDLRDRGIAATRQLAKRQITWLRGMPRRRVIACDGQQPVPELLAGLQRLLNA